MDATCYKFEWRFGGRWSRLAQTAETLAEAQEYARKVFLPPTEADSRPPVRIIKTTTTEEVVDIL